MIIYFYTKALQWEHRSLNVLGGANGFGEAINFGHGWKGWDPQPNPERGLRITMVISHSLHPGKLTWNIIIGVWKIIFLSKWMICRFHVNLPGCNWDDPPSGVPPCSTMMTEHPTGHDDGLDIHRLQCCSVGLKIHWINRRRVSTSIGVNRCWFTEFQARRHKKKMRQARKKGRAFSQPQTVEKANRVANLARFFKLPNPGNTNFYHLWRLVSKKV